MDAIGSVLHYLNLKCVFYSRSELCAPWGLELPALADTLMIHVVVSGECWLQYGDVKRGDVKLGDGKLGDVCQRLRPGDFVLLPHGQGHCLKSTPEVAATQLFALPREQASACYEMLTISGPGEKTILLCGMVQLEHPAARQLIASLPAMIYVGHAASAFAEWTRSTVNLIVSEAAELRPGGESVITRLADILVIQAIRAWMETSPQHSVGWLAAVRDEKIGKAMALIHGNPGHAWTIASLGTAAGMSRAAFAARFAELTGETVMQYLTGWRMRSAMRHIQSGEANIAVLAERMGYQSEAAFRRAFKRTLGFNPGETLLHAQ